jgi:Fe-S-cluster containining protein
MDRQSGFSYLCLQCSKCCHNQVIQLSPYDLIRIARAKGISTAHAIAQYTIRRGSILKFEGNGSCVALNDTICTLHSGRPLACRLYPLGLEHDGRGAERYLRLEAAPGSVGIFGRQATVEDFLADQGVQPYLSANQRYASLIEAFRRRIVELVDFEIVEPREFWRIAVRDALAESNFDPNPIIDMLFNPDGLGCCGETDLDFIQKHIEMVVRRIRAEPNPAVLAAAAVLLAVSLGYSVGEVALLKHGVTLAAIEGTG